MQMAKGLFLPPPPPQKERLETSLELHPKRCMVYLTLSTTGTTTLLITMHYGTQTILNSHIFNVFTLM